jgi:putative N6-adenine-specific DNA methylase
MADDLDIFLTTAPGLEGFLQAEAQEKDFKVTGHDTGGISLRGTWEDIWRANLTLRGASKVLARLGSFRAMHLAQLDKRARQFPWEETLRPDIPVKVEVTCHKSRIYHDKAAAERIANALQATFGAQVTSNASLCIKARIVKDLCTISVDTSGDPLHKRGFKAAVNKAPMRENLAALLLRACGFTGDEPVIDPMCGSGTFIIEAAEIARGLSPGRRRAFSFEELKTFDPEVWETMKADLAEKSDPQSLFYGFDRDAGAVSMSKENAQRAGVGCSANFQQQTISELALPEALANSPGLVVVNPPYGSRIGDQQKLAPLYQTLGARLKERFSGWRVGIVTNDDRLAEATGLTFRKKKTSFSHGGLSVKLYRTNALP